MPLYANKYLKEEEKEEEKEEKEQKEKNTTIFRKYHGELLMTMSDCLFNNTLVH